VIGRWHLTRRTPAPQHVAPASPITTNTPNEQEYSQLSMSQLCHIKNSWFSDTPSSFLMCEYFHVFFSSDSNHNLSGLGLVIGGMDIF